MYLVINSKKALNLYTNRLITAEGERPPWIERQENPADTLLNAFNPLKVKSRAKEILSKIPENRLDAKNELQGIIDVLNQMESLVVNSIQDLIRTHGEDLSKLESRLNELYDEFSYENVPEIPITEETLRGKPQRKEVTMI